MKIPGFNKTPKQIPAQPKVSIPTNARSIGPNNSAIGKGSIPNPPPAKNARDMLVARHAEIMDSQSPTEHKEWSQNWNGRKIAGTPPKKPTGTVSVPVNGRSINTEGGATGKSSIPKPPSPSEAHAAVEARNAELAPKDNRLGHPTWIEQLPAGLRDQAKTTRNALAGDVDHAEQAHTTHPTVANKIALYETENHYSSFTGQGHKGSSPGHASPSHYLDGLQARRKVRDEAKWAYNASKGDMSQVREARKGDAREASHEYDHFKRTHKKEVAADLKRINASTEPTHEEQAEMARLEKHNPMREPKSVLYGGKEISEPVAFDKDGIPHTKEDILSTLKPPHEKPLHENQPDIDLEMGRPDIELARLDMERGRIDPERGLVSLLRDKGPSAFANLHPLEDDRPSPIGSDSRYMQDAQKLVASTDDPATRAKARREIGNEVNDVMPRMLAGHVEPQQIMSRPTLNPTTSKIQPPARNIPRRMEETQRAEFGKGTRLESDSSTGGNFFVPFDRLTGRAPLESGNPYNPAAGDMTGVGAGARNLPPFGPNAQNHALFGIPEGSEPSTRSNTPDSTRPRIMVNSPSPSVSPSSSMEDAQIGRVLGTARRTPTREVTSERLTGIRAELERTRQDLRDFDGGRNTGIPREAYTQRIALAERLIREEENNLRGANLSSPRLNSHRTLLRSHEAALAHARTIPPELRGSTPLEEMEGRITRLRREIRDMERDLLDGEEE
jgi:hypothetical protein